MIFNDYVNFLNEKYTELLGVEYIVKEFNDILAEEDKWISLAFKLGASDMMLNPYNSTNSAQNVTKLIESTKIYNNILRNRLNSIDFYNFIKALLKLETDETNELNKKINDLVSSMKNSYDIIHKYKSCNDNEKLNDYIECIKAMKNIIQLYNSYCYMESFVQTINDSLCNDFHKEKFDLKIRLMNKNDSIEDLIKSIELIKSIYHNIDLVISNGENSLKFKRIESGSLLLVLIGCVPVFKAMKPILEYSYKIYSEQFSVNAKLDRREKDIKVRGEYFKLLKEFSEASGKEINYNEVQDTLFNLDNDIKTLYSKNPFILIDGEEVGVKELKDNIIPIELLETGDNEVEQKK